MTDITVRQINKSSKDIQKLIIMAIEQKNWILLEQSLKRLYSLNKHLGNKLNLQEIEIRNLKTSLEVEVIKNHEWEKEWITEQSKKTNSYNALKNKIDEIWGCQ